jgi:ferredoxin, 2Fe-2S
VTVIDVTSPTVVIQPAGITLHLQPGESILEAAQRTGLFWPSTCNGDVDCGQCWTEVIAGEHCIAPVDAAEQAVLDGGAKAGRPEIRLACCVRPTASGVEVVKRSAKPIPSQTAIEQIAQGAA